MPSQGMHCYGTTLYYSEDFDVTAVTELAEVLSISGPKTKHPETKITHLKSAEKFHEYVPAFGDGDTCELELNYFSANASVLYNLRPSSTDTSPGYGRRSWKIEFPDGSFIRFIGHIAELGPEVPEDDRITQSCTIKVSGPVDHFTG